MCCVIVPPVIASRGLKCLNGKEDKRVPHYGCSGTGGGGLLEALGR